VVGASGCGGGGSSTSTETTTGQQSGAGSSAGESSGNAPTPGGTAVRSEKVEIVDYAYSPDPVTIED